MTPRRFSQLFEYSEDPALANGIKPNVFVTYRGREGVVNSVQGEQAYVRFDDGETSWVPISQLQRDPRAELSYPVRRDKTKHHQRLISSQATP